jgi:hypothetical protein
VGVELKNQVAVAVAAFVAVLAVGAAVLWLNRPIKPIQVTPRGGPQGGTAPLIVDQGMDAVLQQLAQRTARQLGGADDFQVVVTQVGAPIGSLLEKGRSLPDDDTSCRADPEPAAYATPSLFPAFNVSAKTAGDFGLDEPLAKLGVNASSQSTMVLSFQHPGVIALTGARVRDLLNREACAHALAGRDLLMVRGYVVGQRTLVLTDARDNQIKGSVKLGAFDVHPEGQASISIVDDEQQRFLQLVSQVRAPSPSPTPGVATPDISKPTAPVSSQAGRIFIQRDIADDPKNATLAVKLLTDSGYLVAAGVERIPSRKMPNTPQVRYFNADDLPKAQKVVDVLARMSLKAKVVRIPLPSPAGQLEVWLMKAG